MISISSALDEVACTNVCVCTGISRVKFGRVRPERDSSLNRSPSVQTTFTSAGNCVVSCPSCAKSSIGCVFEVFWHFRGDRRRACSAAESSASLILSCGPFLGCLFVSFSLSLFSLLFSVLSSVSCFSFSSLLLSLSFSLSLGVFSLLVEFFPSQKARANEQVVAGQHVLLHKVFGGTGLPVRRLSAKR